MYFTETEVLRELEILMQMIPGFQPKGYGSMVMPDQIYIYLQEPPPPTYQEMIADTMHAVRYRPFLQRVEELLACCPIPPLPAKSGGTSNRKRDEAHELSKQSPSETFPDSHPEKRQEKLCPVVGTLSFYRRSEALAHHEASGGWEPHPV